MLIRIIVYSILFCFFVINCGDSEPPLIEAEKIDKNRAKLYFNMTDDYELEIKVKNFDSKDYVKFNIITNEPSKLDIDEIENGDYTMLFPDDPDDVDPNSINFIFSNVKDDGLLCRIKLDEPNSYENISFHFSELIILPSSDYQECSIDDYNSYSQCINASGEWKDITDIFRKYDLCYIKYSDPEESEELFGGDFGWSDSYCWPWQN